MFTVLPTLKYKTQLTTECLLSDSCILCNCITIVDALTRNLMLQWLILDVATQPNLHIIAFYIPVREEEDFFLLFLFLLHIVKPTILKKYKCV